MRIKTLSGRKRGFSRARLFIFTIFFVSGTSLFAQAIDVDPVTVTGTREEKRLSDSPVATEVISSTEIANSSATTIVDVLKDYGLVSVADPHGDDIRFEGLGGNDVLILIDGRRVTGRLNGFVDGSTLPVGNVDHIEIVRGPLSAIYGSDGMAGVINIITKKPQKKLTFSAALSDRMLPSYNDPDTSEAPSFFAHFDPIREQILSLSLGFPIGSLLNNLSIQGGRGGDYLDEQGAASVLPSYLRASAQLDSTLSVSNALNLSFGGSFMDMQSTSITSVQGSYSRSTSLRTGGYAEARLIASDSARLTLNIYDEYFQRLDDSYLALLDELNYGTGFQYENYVSSTLRADFDLASFNSLTLGAEGSFHYISKDDLDIPNKKAVEDTEALWAQDEFYRDGLFSIVLGARAERNSQYGFSFAPKISAMYYLAPQFRLLAGFGLGYRAPDFTELYVDVSDIPDHPVVYGNPDLKPEYNWGGNLGLEYTAKVFSANVNTFYSELFDQMVYVDQGYAVPDGREVYRTENVDRSYHFGLTADGRVDFLGSLYAKAGYDLVLSFDRVTGQALRDQPIHAVKAELGIQTKTFNAHAAGRFFSPLNEDSSLEPETVSRFILDLYAAWNVAENLQLALAIDNLTGLINSSLGPFVGPELTLSVKTDF